MTMTTSRPYLVRAIHEWILDNNLTPHLLVDIDGDRVKIPAQQGQNGKIVLNISPTAVEGLNLGNGAVSFRARFGGISTDVYVPLESVLAIYARENGRGMVFNEEDNGSSPVDPDKKGGKRPSLKIVK